MMLSNMENANMIYKAINVRRKVGRLSVTFDMLRDYLFTIDMINSMDKDEEIFGNKGELLGTWKIIEPFKTLIYPQSITTSADRDEIDLLIRPIEMGSDDEQEPVINNEEEDKVRGKEPTTLNRVDFNDMSAELASAYKDFFCTVPVCREPMLITEGAKLQIVNGNVTALPISRVPFKLKGQYKKNYFFTKPFSDALYDLIIDRLPKKEQCD